MQRRIGIVVASITGKNSLSPLATLAGECGDNGPIKRKAALTR
jgi:hypothetical protein